MNRTLHNPGDGASATRPARLDVQASRELAAQSCIMIARLHSAIQATRVRLLSSQQRLERSRMLPHESAPAQSSGALAGRIETLATSLEELHLRFAVELSATADDLQSQLTVADEVRSLADFYALVCESLADESEADPARHLF